MSYIEPPTLSSLYLLVSGKLEMLQGSKLSWEVETYSTVDNSLVCKEN